MTKLLLTFVLSSMLSASLLQGRVIRVMDGDTVEILDGGNQTHRIRLYGVDAPEKAQDFGQVSKQFTAGIAAGRQVTVEVIDTDRYGRSVGVVRVGSVILNSELVRTGHAWVYTQYCKKDFCQQWKQLENNARTGRHGLWAQQAVAPWIWRKENK